MSCDLIKLDWEPILPWEHRLDIISKSHNEFVKCVRKSPLMEVRGLMMQFFGEWIFVEPEETICEHCGLRNRMGAVPDFGIPYSANQKAVIWRVPEIACHLCNLPIRRRKRLWLSPEQHPNTHDTGRARLTSR